MSTIQVQRSQAGHWYDSNAVARHTIIGANGKERPTTLRDARKFGWYPSVTGVLSCWPKEQLKNWLRSQDILAAATTPRSPAETDDAWIARVLEAADEQSAAARDVGIRRHAIIEKWNLNQSCEIPPEDAPFIVPYIEWYQANVEHAIAAERIVVNTALGYAGTLDLHCKMKDGTFAIADVKNRAKAVAYPDDCLQLGAYRMAINENTEIQVPIRCISLILGTKAAELCVKEWTPEELDDAELDFRACLVLWQRAKKYVPGRAA